MTDNGIELYQGGAVMPVIDVQSALKRFQDMKDYITGVLRKDVDYGVIPGTNKPTLLKPGAEKLNWFFGLRPVFKDIEQVEDWSGKDHDGEPFFYYRVQCQLMRRGELIAAADGSCNSWEKKYRYRSSQRKCPVCGKETIIKGKEEYGGGWICYKNKGGCGAKFGDKDNSILDQVVGQMRNPDISDVVNTILKMAQKRALVAATLIGANASEWFTQDMEDFVDGVVVDVTPTTSTPQPTNGNPQPPAPEPTSAPAGDPTMSQTKNRPYDTMETPELSDHLNGMLKSKKPEYQAKIAEIQRILRDRNSGKATVQPWPVESEAPDAWLGADQMPA